MTVQNQSSKTRRAGPKMVEPAVRSAVTRGCVTGLLLTLPLWLGACSSFLFEDEELAPQRIQVDSQRPADPEFPNLASVPDQAPQPSASVQRESLVEGLSADRQNARYSDQPLTPQAAAAGVGESSDLGFPPPPSVGSALPGGNNQTAANSQVPPPPDIGGSAALDEPAIPPPPAPAPRAAAAADAAPPPPAAALPDTSAPPVPAAPSDAVPSGDLPDEILPSETAPSAAASDDLTYPVATGLLQERAFQQEAMAQQKMQQLAAERYAFEEQARQQAIEQQWQREQLIQQQAQWRYPAAVQQQASRQPIAPAAGPAAVPAPQAYAGFAGAPGQLVGLIYFGHGSAGLDSRDRQILGQIAALQQQQGRNLRVVGHASARTSAIDPVRHRSVNQKMSMRRARAVTDALIRFGTAQGRIMVDGAGDGQPVYHEFTTVGEAGNRRVEIYLE